MSDPSATVIECRAEYAIGSSIIALRLFTRWKTLGRRGFYWDDFFAFWSWVFFTMIYVMVEYLSKSKPQVNLLGNHADCCCRCDGRPHSHDTRTARSTSTGDAEVDARGCEGHVCFFLLSHLPCLEFEGLSHHPLPPPDVSSRRLT
jgi:hypothetical protein